MNFISNKDKKRKIAQFWVIPFVSGCFAAVGYLVTNQIFMVSSISSQDQEVKMPSREYVEAEQNQLVINQSNTAKQTKKRIKEEGVSTIRKLYHIPSLEEISDDSYDEKVSKRNQNTYNFYQEGLIKSESKDSLLKSYQDQLNPKSNDDISQNKDLSKKETDVFEQLFNSLPEP